MCAVTIVTFGRLRVSELRDFAVISIEIGICNRLVTSPALRHDLQLEPRLIGSTDRVSSVTVAADRELLFRLGYSSCVNASLELLLNSVMTTSAGLRHLVPIDTRQRVTLRQHAVSCVAVGTHRRHRETTLHQPLAMDALRIVLDDVVLTAGITNRGLFPLAMTVSAQHRHVCRKCR